MDNLPVHKVAGVAVAIEAAGDEQIAHLHSVEDPSLWWDASDSRRRIGLAISDRRAVTVLLTSEHLSKMIKDYLLMENEIGDRVRVTRIMQKLLDTRPSIP